MADFAGWKIRIENQAAFNEAMDKKRLELREGATEVAVVSAVRFRGRIVRNIERTFGFTKSRVPRPKTNRLSRGVRTFVENVPTGVRVIGGVSATVPYARIQERGGQTRSHYIVPRRKQALRWVRSEFIGAIRLDKRGRPTKQSNAGAFAYAKAVFHPGSTLRARPYMQPAAIDELPALVEDLKRRYRQVLEKKGK